jgi:hypothetical protein
MALLFMANGIGEKIKTVKSNQWICGRLASASSFAFTVTKATDAPFAVKK